MHIDGKKPRPKRRNRDVPAETESEPATAFPPCQHNKWFRIRKAKEFVRLVCLNKECGLTWKTDLSAHTKCEDFYTGSCLKDGACKHPHIYSRFHLKKFRIDVPTIWDDESVVSPCGKRSEEPSGSDDEERRAEHIPPASGGEHEHPQEMWRRLMGLNGERAAAADAAATGGPQPQTDQ